MTHFDFRRLLEPIGPSTKAIPTPAEHSVQPDEMSQKVAHVRFGRYRCFQCGRLLYRNNRSLVCYRCQRKWGLATLRRRLIALQHWHLQRCEKRDCSDPAHFAHLMPLRPRSPRRRAGSKDPIPERLVPVSVNLLLDRMTSARLTERAEAKSAHLGFRITKADLVREAIHEHFKNHPDTEFFADATPGENEPELA